MALKKNKLLVTNEKLTDAIKHSYKFCDKFGRHSNELGVLIREMALIAVKNNTDRQLSEYRLQELASDVVYMMFKEISSEKMKQNGKQPFRHQFEAGEIGNCFTYFFSVAKWSAKRAVENELVLKKYDEMFAEACFEAIKDSVEREKEDGYLDRASTVDFDYCGYTSYDC
jgi:hypothetical protein